MGRVIRCGDQGCPAGEEKALSRGQAEEELRDAGRAMVARAWRTGSRGRKVGTSVVRLRERARSANSTWGTTDSCCPAAAISRAAVSMVGQVRPCSYADTGRGSGGAGYLRLLGRCALLTGNRTDLLHRTGSPGEGLIGEVDEDDVPIGTVQVGPGVLVGDRSAFWSGRPIGDIVQ